MHLIHLFLHQIDLVLSLFSMIRLNAGLTLFDFLELAFHEVLLVENFALPVVIIFIKVFDVVLSHDHVEVVTLLVDLLLRTKDVDDTLHVGHELEFVLQGECRPLSDDPVKRVSHDGYEHVKEGDLRDERRSNED